MHIIFYTFGTYPYAQDEAVNENIYIASSHLVRLDLVKMYVVLITLSPFSYLPAWNVNNKQ